MQYVKPSLTILEQIERLRSRGLIIENIELAEETLARISYYRLSAYTHFFQKSNSPQHEYQQGSTFEAVLNLYKFDKSLRMLIFNAIESIEVAVRTQIIYQLSQAYGSHWYLDQSLFASKSFHQSLVDEIRSCCRKNNVEPFIKHYYQKYSTPELPPCYMAIEIISFGWLSKLFKNLNSSEACTHIHENFGVPYKVLVSWLHSLCHIRNICAHHSRLWNSYLPISPIIPKTLRNSWLKRQTASYIRQHDKNKIFISLCSIQYLLNSINSNHKFHKHLIDTFTLYPSVPIRIMGFFETWKEEPLWSLKNL